MLTSPNAARLFDLGREEDAEKDRYGRFDLGINVAFERPLW